MYSTNYERLIKIHRAIRKWWWLYIIPVKLKAIGVSIQGRVMCHGMPIVSMTPGSSIEIGDDVVICSAPEMTALGVSHPAVFRTLRPEAVIRIGRGTGISGGSLCAASEITIGQDCLIGADVIIADTDFHAINPIGRRINNNADDIRTNPIRIDDNVFIGMRSVILKGVRIGRNSIVAAGSVVTKDVPNNAIHAGNPAKLVRYLNEEDAPMLNRASKTEMI